MAAYVLYFFFYFYFIFFTPTSSNSTATTNHKWVGPSGHRHITVDIYGFGDYTTVQAAVDSVSTNNQKNILIHITAGVYVEKVVVPATKPYITFEGEGRKTTVIEWHDRASDRGPDGQQLRTYQTASVTVYANYFSARNISFKNTAPAPMPGMHGWQAAAFRISGDKAYFSGCGFYGAQDTLCDDAGRHYFKECYIEGSIDFIFGNGRSMYKDCELHSIAKRFGSIAAQDRRIPDDKSGFAFVGCKVTGTGPLYVGRAMGQYSRIVYSYTYFDDVVAHGGWDDWDHTGNKSKTAYFGVYRCWGPGAAAVRGVSWARELDYESAHKFLVKSFVNGRHWIAPSDA
ncbi:probable pectinesterase 68 [Cynara cardunculus var. scolymus]|uniref:probable pectinesterase 68 n=1 Tax=Cynara cardunculus var. scolymus TaxID=59895 RepID=UPI000D62D3E2|nr:probable pectinesterase 68 [Cynara cardunculus var. scolymus]